MNTDKRRGRHIVPGQWVVMTTLSLAGLACGLVSPGGGVSKTPNVGGGGGQVAVNVTDVDGTAKQVYDQVAAGQDVVPLLAGIFQGLGVSVLNFEKDKDKGLTMIKSGQAAIFDLQLSLIAQGYSSGTMVTAQSLADDLSDHGVQATVPAGPLTLAYLSGKMAYLADKHDLAPQEVLPALIMALGRERSRRPGGQGSDPVWGDGLLDPFQYEILVYGIAFSGLRSGATSVPASGRLLGAALAGPGLLPQLARRWLGEGGGGGFFDTLLKSIGELNVFEFAACGVALIYGAQFSLDAEPINIYHRQADGTNPPPSKSTITGHLIYTANLSPNTRDALIATFGCTLPLKSGPMPDKTVAWSLDDVATKHGSLTRQDNKTKEDGSVTAEYQAIDETTPHSLRLDATRTKVEAELQATVLDLLPDHRRLEAAARLMGGGGPYGFSYLTINFYGKLAMDIEGTFQFAGRGTTPTNTVHKQTIEIEDQGGVLQGQGDVTVDTSASLNCGSGGIVNGKGAFTGQVVVYVAPGAPPNSDQLTFTMAPSLSSIKPPIADIQCMHGNLNDVAWAALVSLMGAKFTLGGSNTSYAYTPPGGTGTVNFTLHAAAP